MAKKIAKMSAKKLVVDIDKLIPYEFNNKDHPEQQVNLLANSIAEFWYLDEIIVDSNNIIIAWHWRLEALKKMWYDQVEVKVLPLDSRDSRALRLFHNKLSELWENNLDNIKFELDNIGDYELWDFTVGNFYQELDLPSYDPTQYNPDESNWEDDEKLVVITVQLQNKQEWERLYNDLKDMWYENVKKQWF